MDLRSLVFGEGRRLGRRMTVLVIAFSSLAGICFSAVQLAAEYRGLRHALDRQLDDVGIYVRALEGSVWDFDAAQIQRAIDALALVPDVARVRLITSDGEWTAGADRPGSTVRRTYPLRHLHRGQELDIGRVEVVASLEGIHRRMMASAAWILAGNALEMALVTVLMMFLVRRMVTARLERMARRVRDLVPGLLPPGQGAEALPVPRSLDELDAVDWALSRTTEELRAAVAALRVSEEQLRQAQKLEAVGRLAAGVAHDFNNLLTAILGDAELLAEHGAPDGPLREAALEIEAAAQRAALLTRQLLAFGRRQTARPLVLDLNEVVASLDHMLRRLIGEDVELRTLTAPGLGRVRADPGQLEQVIVNLAVNARDAMPGGGRLTLETRNADLPVDASRRGERRPGVLLSVSDTGCGMGPEVRGHLFEPFFTTKGPGRGTGLGLSTLYGIVKQSGGEVEVQSEPGQGSVFQVYLPRVDEEVERPPEQAGGRPAAGGTETVLVVDDEPLVRALAVRVLRAAGYAVRDAADGDEALRLVASGAAIDLLVCDVVLPRRSGPVLAAELRAGQPELPVLFVSGYAGSALDPASLGGGSAFLPKPFTPRDLVRMVRELLDRRGRPTFPVAQRSRP